MMSVGELAAFDDQACEAVQTDNQQLLDRIRSGERTAFEDLVNKFHRSIYSLALRLTLDPEDARDISQETFLKVYNNINSFRGDADLLTWIYRITVNLAANHHRWWRRRSRNLSVAIDESFALPSPALSPEQFAIASEQRRLIALALDKIKFHFRVAVILRDIDGLSYEEIAETLEVSVGTVKSRIARGREELRKLLRGSFNGHE